MNDKDITANLRPRLLSLTLTDNRGFETDQLDIELDDADGQLRMPERGAVISVFLGRQGEALTSKGDFTVDEVEHHGAPDTLTLRARSADFLGTLNSRREVSYHDTNLGDIVAQIAARNSLSPVVAAALKSIAIPHIDQTQETDAAFLTRLVELNGAVAVIKAAAMRAATAKWNKLQRGVTEFSLALAMGRADLYPETPVAVKGFK